MQQAKKWNNYSCARKFISYNFLEQQFPKNNGKQGKKKKINFINESFTKKNFIIRKKAIAYLLIENSEKYKIKCKIHTKNNLAVITKDTTKDNISIVPRMPYPLHCYYK